LSLTLSVIIVNYNSGRFLKRALDSVKGTSAVKYEIIVVDNASTDESLKLIENENVKLIRLNENIGFGPANNIGLKEARGEFILFLNPDAELLPESINQMLEIFKEPKAGATSCILVFPDGKFQPSFGLMDKGIIGEFFDKFIASWFLPVYLKLKKKPFEVNWLSGAAILTKQEVLEKIGGFDPKFFLYMEDVDLCRRIRLAGYRIILNPNCRVIHHLGKSGGKKDRAFFESKRSQLTYYKKWKSSFQNWLIKKYLKLRLGKDFKKLSV